MVQVCFGIRQPDSPWKCLHFPLGYTLSVRDHYGCGAMLFCILYLDVAKELLVALHSNRSGEDSEECTAFLNLIAFSPLYFLHRRLWTKQLGR